MSSIEPNRLYYYTATTPVSFGERKLCITRRHYYLYGGNHKSNPSSQDEEEKV